MAEQRKVIRPSTELVNSYLGKWQRLAKYTLQEECLNLLFQQLCPRNDQIHHVLLKVSALNDFYSTNIFDTHSVAKHIIEIGVSERVAAGDIGVVDEMAQMKIGGKPRKFYSFASKYCNHHYPEAFPIYDNYVDKMLRHFRRVDSFAEFRRDDLKNYVRFVEIVKLFRSSYELDHFSLREVDIYLWLAGKEEFSQWNV